MSKETIHGSEERLIQIIVHYTIVPPLSVVLHLSLIDPKGETGNDLR